MHWACVGGRLSARSHATTENQGAAAGLGCAQPNPPRTSTRSRPVSCCASCTSCSAVASSSSSSRFSSSHAAVSLSRAAHSRSSSCFSNCEKGRSAVGVGGQAGSLAAGVRAGKPGPSLLACACLPAPRSAAAAAPTSCSPAVPSAAGSCPAAACDWRPPSPHHAEPAAAPPAGCSVCHAGRWRRSVGQEECRRWWGQAAAFPLSSLPSP